VEKAEISASEGRLAAVVDLVPVASTVADVGTDAALLPRMLLEAGRIRRCIASDHNETSLATARRLSERHLDSGSLELRGATGLQALSLDDGVEVITITGLGARATIRILDDERLATLAPRRLVLQPQTEPSRLRRWLVDHGYSIVDEVLRREGRHFYVVVAAEPRPDAVLASQGALDAEDLLEAGPCLVRSGDPLVREYWERALRREQRTLERCGGGERASRSRHRRDRALRVLAELSRRDEAAPPSDILQCCCDVGKSRGGKPDA